MAHPPTLHLVRHAQGFHNLSVANHDMPDPLLTDYGIQQCQHLHDAFPHMSSISLIVASPLKRTIYTALHSFRSVIADKKLRVIALPEIQETSDLPCDTGSSYEELEREFAGQPVDLSLVKARPDWNNKKGDWAPWADPLHARAKRARQWLRHRSEDHIAVVTHGGFLHYFTEDFDGFQKFNGTGWANTEFRSYYFDPHRTASASFIETPDSRVRRGGSEKPLSEAEQRNLEGSAMQSWHQSGYQKDAIKPVQIQSKFPKAQHDRDWVGGY